jgi:HEAT repeat protein
MTTIGISEPLVGWSRTFRTFLLCGLLGFVAYTHALPQAQVDKPAFGLDKSKVSAAIARVSSGKYSAFDVDLIGRAGAVEAIPDLKKQFVNSSDALDKAKIAQALVKLGDNDQTYWQLLVSRAEVAIDDDAPAFLIYDAQGKAQPGPSPAFLAWTKSHNVPLRTAWENAMYIYPGDVALLGETGDARAIPLLRRALLSQNYLVRTAAAQGLAEIHDQYSIPNIIDAAQNAPADAAGAIVRSLVYFDDPRAQNAVDTYLTKEHAKALRDARSKGKTPYY